MTYEDAQNKSGKFFDAYHVFGKTYEQAQYPAVTMMRAVRAKGGKKHE